MARSKSAQPASSQPEPEDSKSPKKERRVIKFKIWPPEIIGPVDLVLAIILGTVIGAVGIVILINAFHLRAVFDQWLTGPPPTVPPVVQTAPTSVSPVATATPLPSGAVFSFEQTPLFAFGYSGFFDPKVNTGMGLLSVRRKGSAGTSYRLEYRLPAAGEGNGYAGMALQFTDPPDWSDYQAIEVTITYGDEAVRCDIGIMDEANKVDYVRLGDRSLYGEGVTATVSDEGDTVTIPFDTHFDTINLKLVKMVLFNIDSSISSGNHEFTVQSLRLLKSADGAAP